MNIHSESLKKKSSTQIFLPRDCAPNLLKTEVYFLKHFIHENYMTIQIYIHSNVIIQRHKRKHITHSN